MALAETAQHLPRFSLVGPEGQPGTYLLRLQVAADLRLAFGRFQGGRPLSVPRGEYLYLGSALGSRGGASLAGRLLRHASRSGGCRPHKLRGALALYLEAAGLYASVPREKRLFWHVDYLLERAEVEISHLILLRSPERQEAAIAGLLLGDPWVQVIAPGLGASDSPGSTHLLRVEGDEVWWVALLAKLERRGL